MEHPSATCVGRMSNSLCVQMGILSFFDCFLECSDASRLGICRRAVELPLVRQYVFGSNDLRVNSLRRRTYTCCCLGRRLCCSAGTKQDCERRQSIRRQRGLRFGYISLNATLRERYAWKGCSWRCGVLRKVLVETSNLNIDCVVLSLTRRRGELVATKASTGSGPSWGQQVDLKENSSADQGLSQNGAITEEAVGCQLFYTLRLVECSMLAATVGLAYVLSNLLRVENYFGCFFPLPPVISSLRWGAAAGRKTMVATAMLLLVLSGPLKAASYLLMHGFVGMTMGALWRWGINWSFSIVVCTVVRSFGALGFVFLTSWLLRDNLLALITLNAHTSISYMLSAIGISTVPSMRTIYFVFATLVLLNCGSFVFLLHVLYAFILPRLGIKSSVSFPTWIKPV
eukprot:c23977_g1_i1 orf=148-1347(+)